MKTKKQIDQDYKKLKSQIAKLYNSNGLTWLECDKLNRELECAYKNELERINNV